MKNKRRLIVLLLTLSMVLSQMSLVAFADTEPAGEPEQTATEQTVPEQTVVEETQPEEVAFDQTVTVDKVDITVKADKGVFPANAELTAKAVARPDAIDAENALAFDIKVLVDGQEVQPKDNAKVEVSFKTAEVKDANTEVYHMDGNKADKLDVETKGDTATVETTGFSTYVLVFTNVTSGQDSGTINYSMGDKQTVALSTIVGSFIPNTASTIDSGTFSWDFTGASTDSSKITVNSGKVSVNSSSTFDDGETAEVEIPYSYKHGNEPKSGKATVRITFRNPNVTGRIIAPTAVDGLIYSSQEQGLIEQGSTEFGKMQYKVASMASWTNDASDIKGKAAKTYTVYWQVVLDDGTTIKSGSVTNAKINKKTATLTIRGGSRVYDGSETELTAAAKVQVTGMAGGETIAETTDYVLSADKNPIKEIGEYAISATTVASSTVLKNYDLTIVPGTYSITDREKEAITKTVAESDPTAISHKGDAGSYNWVYDGKKHGVKVTVTNPDKATVYYSRTLLNAGNFSTAGDTNPENVYPTDAGTYPIYYYIVADGYAPLAGSQTVKIDQAYLRVAVAPAEKTVTYGDHVNYKNQSWTAAINAGNVTFNAYKEETETTTLSVVTDSIGNLDKLAFDMGTYSGDMSDVGKYNIDLQNNLTSPNYVIRTTGGTLTVNPKPVDFYWLSEPDGKTEGFTWPYDGQEHGLRAYITEGQLVGTDAAEGQVEIIYETRRPNDYTNAATDVKRNDETWNVENYTAKVLKLGGERGHNYTFYKTGDTLPEGKTVTSEQTFTITPVDLTLKPNAVTTTFGDVPVDNGYTATGLVNGEKAEDVLLGTPVLYSFDGVQGSNVGTYDINITNVATPNRKADNSLHAQNYTVVAEENVKGQTIVPRPVTLVWSKPNSFMYDGKNHDVSVVEVKNNYAPKSAIAGATYEDEKKVDAGNYTAKITLATEPKGNYTIQDDSDKYDWEITKRPATIYVNSNSITYGQDPADKGYYIADENLVKRLDAEDFDKLADITLVTDYKKNGKPGSYAINAVYTNLNDNYYIAGVKQGTLSVSDRKTVLNAKGTKSGKKAVRISWDGVTGAASYDVYASMCNTKKKVYTPVYVGRTTGTSFKLKKIGKKKLKTRTPYKYYVVAKDASGNVIAQSQIGHFITNNVKGKKVNAKSMAVNTHSVTIAKGGTAGLSASYKKAKKGKKYKLLDGDHAPLTRFVSENPAVATVAANGVVTGVGTGWTRVYVYGVTGMWETVEVYVQ